MNQIKLPQIPYELELELDYLKLKFYKITQDDLKIEMNEVILKKPDFFNIEKVKEIIDKTEAHIIEFIPIYKDNEIGISFEGKIEEIRKTE